VAARPISSWFRPALLRTIWLQARLSWRLLREPQVPRTTKALIALPALYLVSPFDLLPDLVPIIGQLDDLGVLLLALQAFVSLCPAAAVMFHRRAIETGQMFRPMAPRDVVIDAEWHRE
jgi:uncharacterized membrane protein YkvA (DUF1232 family)